MRPLIHLTAEHGWVNDPHGITFHDGLYHLFHQYVPGSMVHDPACRWGHAVSTNLLHWEHRPVALEPGDGDDGIWTGSLAMTQEGPVILYTSVTSRDYDDGRVRLATPTDSSWDYWEKGPVVMTAPRDHELIAFRDPFVLREESGWRCFLGGATPDGRAQALTYTSADLRSWTYDGIALERSTAQCEPVWMGALWECPQFVDLGGQWAMVSSVWDANTLHYAGYALGAYEAGRLRATTWGRLSLGGSYYAPSVFRDADGRPCVMYWVRGVKDEKEGWASCLSLPQVLSIRDGRLWAELHPDVRAQANPAQDRTTPGGASLVTWRPSAGDRLDLGEGTYFVARPQEIILHRVDEEDWAMPYHGGVIEIVTDGPVLEILVDGWALAAPIRPASSFVTEAPCSVATLGRW